VTTATTTEFRGTRRRALGPARDALAICGRNLIAFYRVPRLLVFSTIQPLVFVFLFRYVFGGVAALAIPGIPYVDFLMPGVFVQVAVFGAMNTAVGLASDLQTGLLERFASLPMARSAVLAGRTLADLTRNVFVVTLMVTVGFAVGFRTHLGAGPFLAAMLLVLLFGFAMSWIFAVVGLAVGDRSCRQCAQWRRRTGDDDLRVGILPQGHSAVVAVCLGRRILIGDRTLFSRGGREARVAVDRAHAPSAN